MGAFLIVAIPCYSWLVGTPPTADAPVGVLTKRQQFEMYPKRLSLTGSYSLVDKHAIYSTGNF